MDTAAIHSENFHLPLYSITKRILKIDNEQDKYMQEDLILDIPPLCMNNYLNATWYTSCQNLRINQKHISEDRFNDLQGVRRVRDVYSSESGEP